ncbi:hypothetical protein FZC76_06825 [Sutcliffiella horikoshii]|uniref:Phage tail tape measure protein n=1 Tax=Sutcliffiella horikoshii TaxID=79883 RepID=A0A5D4SZJ8_9BACI|nr:hypothetical protein [Sutcliffiella horikoshii]TYS68655.1 hypothetical protein FZC76_06825 [Sutcliffiella horikoshii]
MEIFKLFGSILVDTDKADESLSKTEKKADGVGSKFVEGIKTVGKWGVAVAGAATAAGGVLATFTGRAMNVAAEIDKFSQVTGHSTDAFQRWDGVMKTVGYSMEQASGDIAALGEKAMDAANGVGEGAELFGKLGVAVTDSSGKLKSQEQIFQETITALQGMENATERNAIASALLSTTGEELAPILNMTAEELAKMKENANVISEEDLQKAARFKEGWNQAKNTLSNLATTLGIQLMPMFQTVLDWVTENMPQIQTFIEEAFDRASAAIQFFTTEILPPVQAGFSVLIGWIQQLISYVQTWVSSNSEQLGGLRDYFLNFFELVKGFFSDFVTFVTTLWAQYGEQIVSTITAALSAVVSFVQEKLAVLLKFWQDNGAQIMTAVQNVFNLILGIIKAVMPVVISVIQTAWNVVKGVFDGALNIIMGAVKVFTGLFTGDWRKLGEGLKQIWSGLWNAIKAILSGAWSLLSGAFGTIKRNISNWFSGLKTDAIRWGKNMISGFIDGITAMIGKVREVASNVMSNVKGFLGFNSPAEEGEGRHIVEWGSNMIDGFLEGAEKMLPDARALMNNVVGEMKPEPSNGTGSFNAQKGNVVIPISVDGYEIARAVIPIIDIIQQQEIDTNLFMKGMKT